MPYLYHMVPPNIVGNHLLPLNQLRGVNLSIYEDSAQKYTWRKHLMEEKIPTLDCLWNDVIFLTAVHPDDLVQALWEAGRQYRFPTGFFQIDLAMLEPHLLTVYLFSRADSNTRKYVSLKPEDVSKYAIVPETTKIYFKEEISAGRHPLLFRNIPHILYKGPICIDGLPIVHPKQPID